MITILVLAALAGWGVVLRRRCRWAPEVIPLALAAAVIDVLLVAAVAGSLRAGVWLLIAAGVLGGLFEWRAAGWKTPRRVAATPALVIFAIVSIVSAWWLRPAALWTFDEFAHWGLIAKVMITTGHLPAADSAVIFADYPPGSALFYYFLTFGRDYSEAALYAAHAVLVFAAVCAVCIGSGWLAAGAAFVAGYFALFAFAGGVQVLSADVLVALFFGAALGAYFRDD